MGRLLLSLSLLLLLYSCSSEDDYVIWQKSVGQGDCYSVSSTPDSGFAACGELGGKPYTVSFSSGYSLQGSYKADFPGTFTSVVAGREIMIAAGTDGSHPYIAAVTREGELLWDTLFSGIEGTDRVALCTMGSNEYLAVASPSPDFDRASDTTLAFIAFSQSGTVSSVRKLTSANFVSASSVAADGSGNIFVALIRASATSKTRASVARYSIALSPVWETVLYNNPVYAASSLSVVLGEDGSVYVSGKTEVEKDDGVNDNAFAVCVSSSGTVRWKNYLEFFSAGESVTVDAEDTPVVLNASCFVLNKTDAGDGSITGILRLFNACDPRNTDAYGRSVAASPDNRFITGGTRGGSFYLAVKSATDVSPV